MKTFNSKFIFVFSLVIVMIACNRENVLPENLKAPQLPETSYDYKAVMSEVQNFRLPGTLTNAGLNGSDIIIVDGGEVINHGGEIDNSLQNSNILNNQVTSNEVATLGRVLFYDEQLSKNNSISCASCHKQELAFSDNVQFSEGFGGKLTSRNSMSIANPIVNESFFWDSRSQSLRDLALRPIQNHVEMGMESIQELTSKISNTDYYDELFQKAYGSSQVTGDKIANALSQFVASVFKKDSKFDQALESGFNNMSELEKHGLALFFSNETKCASCHTGANFSTPTGNDSPYQETAGTANIGLNTIYEDNGFGEGKFRIPSLRNIALTGPYMHDGRFATLREVLNHYNQGIKPHAELDEKLHSAGTPIRLGLTDLDLDALEAFLNTLTSETIRSDEKFSNPFQI